MAFGIYFLSHDHTVLLNDGARHAVHEVRTRPGSILAPKFPAPLGQRGITLIRVMTSCLGLINVATGGQGVASSNVYVIYYLRGLDPHSGEPFLLTDGIAVGYGARSFADGIDAVYLVANENYPAEFLDLADHAAAAAGVIREIEMLADDAMLSIRIEANPPWGVAGGQNGRGGRCVINPGRPDERVIEPLSDGTILKRGDVMRIETGGGGGWGHPYDRPAAEVQADVLGGFVTLAAARTDYGVALSDDGRTIDDAATTTLRQQRFPTRMFHRGEYTDA
jgi:N-methylhydantoinase B